MRFKKGWVMVCALLGMTCSLWAASRELSDEFRVFQLNTWHEGTVIPDGEAMILAEIDRSEADVVFLCEIRNRKGSFRDRILKTLKEQYHKEYFATADSGYLILSRHPVTLEQGIDSGVFARIQWRGREIDLYCMHLNYLGYASVMPRGCCPNTFQPTPAGPVTDLELLAAVNRHSGRVEAVRKVVDAARTSLDAGRTVLIGGDFNEPSHLDWTARTSHLYERNGVAMEWATSRLLESAGYRDCFRVCYPNEETHPGFTFPVDNPDAEMQYLTWMPQIDERERIDFLYCQSPAGWEPKTVTLVGPSTMVVKGERDPSVTADGVLAPLKGWPSDHRGMLTDFAVQKQ